MFQIKIKSPCNIIGLQYMIMDTDQQDDRYFQIRIMNMIDSLY